MLAECHLAQTVLKPFIVKADYTYTMARAQEDLETALLEENYEKRDVLLKSAIQLINITRYKLREKHDGEEKRNNTPWNAGISLEGDGGSGAGNENPS